MLRPISIIATTITLCCLVGTGESFLPSTTKTSTTVQTSAFWRHWIPETDMKNIFMAGDDDNNNYNSVVKEEEKVVSTSKSPKPLPTHEDVLDKARNIFMGSFVTAALLVTVLSSSTSVVHAVSGGGLDYANLDITGQNFANGNYKGKDFTQVIAKGTDFSKSNLQGCRFYKAYLVNADFSESDLRGASLEDTSMDDANLRGAIAAGSYFSKSLLDVASVTNVDFTDAQIPMKTLPLLCEREDLTGTNPVTGVDTRDSAMCP